MVVKKIIRNSGESLGCGIFFNFFLQWNPLKNNFTNLLVSVYGFCNLLQDNDFLLFFAENLKATE